MDLKEIAVAVAGATLFAVVLAPPLWLVFKGIDMFERLAKQDLERIYANTDRMTTAMGSEPHVSFKYHTYSGVLLWVNQVEHRISAPPEVARDALRALLRHTLKYGLLAYGALFIPLLAYSSYIGQKRSLRRQSASQRRGTVSDAQPR